MTSLIHRRLAILFLFVLACAGTALSASAGELKLDVRLVWGTNDEKSPNPDHKPVDGKIAAVLSKAFKWKSYFLVNSQKVDVANRECKKVKLSDHSEVNICELEGDKIEIQVFGKGKLIRKIVEPLTKDGIVVIAGDDKNESAWFIIIKNR